MRNRIAVFSGTKEGHMLAKMLCEQEILVTVFVSQDSEELVMEPNPFLKIMKGSLSRQGLEDILKGFTLVVDASHQVEVSISIMLREISKKISIPLLRVKQEKRRETNEISVNSVNQAVQYLSTQNGNVMVSIGTKDLNMFSDMGYLKQKVYVRVAPKVEELLACSMAGFESKQIIAMEGPVSAELMHAHMKEYNIRYLVIRETDLEYDRMGQMEAISPNGVQVIVVKNKALEGGTSVEETFKLAKQFLG